MDFRVFFLKTHLSKKRDAPLHIMEFSERYYRQFFGNSSIKKYLINPHISLSIRHSSIRHFNQHAFGLRYLVLKLKVFKTSRVPAQCIFDSYGRRRLWSFLACFLRWGYNLARKSMDQKGPEPFWYITHFEISKDGHCKRSSIRKTQLLKWNPDF